MTDVMADGMVEEFATNPLVTTLDEHEALCQRLGLGSRPQGSHPLMRATPAAIVRALEHYPEWKGRQLKAWRKFMPTVYREPAWHDYRFDIVPLRALKAIEAAKATGLFDRLEIWTPEHRAFRRSPFRWLVDEVDPVCVGVIQGRVFPIVRWGQEELVSGWQVRLAGLFLRDPDRPTRLYGYRSGRIST